MSETSGAEFVTIPELAAASRQSIDLDDEEAALQAVAAIHRAEAQLAGWLRSEGLEERQVVQVSSLRRPRNTVELIDGPVTSIANVNSVKVGGEAVDLSTIRLAHRWAIGRTDDFPKDTDIEVDFLAGFRIESDGTTTMPSIVKQALLALAVDVWTNPDARKVSEKIGDYQYTTAAATRAAPEEDDIPQHVQRMLRGWRKPQL